MKVCDAFNLLIFSHLCQFKVCKMYRSAINDAIDQKHNYLPNLLAKTEILGKNWGNHIERKTA